MRLKLAIIGDVHCAFDERDVAYFNRSDYDAVLFVGDLPGLRHGRAYDVARVIAQIDKPVFLIPGNHDATTLNQLLAELGGLGPMKRFGGRSQHARVSRLGQALGDAVVVGYSWHSLGGGVGLIAARPHAMGNTLSFATYIGAAYGIYSLEESAERLKSIIDECPYERLVFLAHNGPTGLGDRPTDIWGCDFKAGGGDWGDRDLRAAIDHATEIGRDVALVTAGHMHQMTKLKKLRTWYVQQEGTHYVNAARVPRIFKRDGALLRHHVRVELGPASVEVTEQLVLSP